MKAKIYNKKKLFSLLILPFVASNITAKSTLAAGTVYNPGPGEFVNISTPRDSYRIFTYNDEVTVTLFAPANEIPARISNYPDYLNYYPYTWDNGPAAVHLGSGGTVRMQPGTSITTDNPSGYAYGVEFYNAGDNAAVNTVTMNQGTIGAYADHGEAIGIYSSYSDNFGAYDIATNISLTDGSEINAISGDGGEEHASAAGILLANSNSTIVLDNHSSINVAAEADKFYPSSWAPATAVAAGIVTSDMNDRVDNQISLDNYSNIDVSADARSGNYAAAQTMFASGIATSSDYGGDTTISLSNNSSINVNADANAQLGATTMYTAGIRAEGSDKYADYGDQSDVSVTLANNSSITVNANANLEAGWNYASMAESHGTYGIITDTHYGNSDISLDDSTIEAYALADNNRPGTYRTDSALAYDTFGIDSSSNYGNASVTLSNLADVSATAKAFAADSAVASAVGISTDTNPYYYLNYSYGDATVTLELGSTVTATAETGVTPADSAWQYANGINSDNSRAMAGGIRANTDQGDARISLDDSSVSATATATLTTAAATNPAAHAATTADIYATAEGLYADVDGDGIASIMLSNTATVTATATATSDSSAGVYASNNHDTWSDAAGIIAYSHWDEVDITLNNAAVAATAEATATGNAASSSNDATAHAYGIGAEGGSAQLAVTLADNSLVSATATATADNWASAEGIGIKAYNNNSPLYAVWASATVSLDASAVDVIATANSTGIGIDGSPGATANATSIYARTDGYLYDAAVTVNNLSSVSAEAYATADAGEAHADAYGIYADSDYTDADITVSLDSSISANAVAATTETGTADAYATATGLWADGAEGASVTVTDSSVSADASATTVANDAEAYAYGIYVEAGNTSAVVTLDNSTVTATATATGATLSEPSVAPTISGWTQAGAYGLEFDSYAETNTVSLTGSTISADAEATGYEAEADAIGIYIDGNQEYDNTNTIAVTLNNTEIVASAQATGANKYYYDSNADTTGILLYGAAEATVALSYGSSVYATATALNTDLYGDSDTDVEGIVAESDSRQYDSNHGDSLSTVSLDNSWVGAYAYATAGGNANADATGIFSNTDATSDAYSYDSVSYGYTAVNLNDSSLDVYAAATGKYADAAALGIETDGDVESDSYYSSSAAVNNVVTLDNSTINSQATANGEDEAYADAAGIYAWADVYADSGELNSVATSDITINLSNGSSITATATASPSDEYASPYVTAGAVGILAHANSYAEAYDEIGLPPPPFAGVYLPQYAGGISQTDISINLDNSTVSATAEATGYGGSANAAAIGADADAESWTEFTYAASNADVYIDVAESSLNAAATFTGDGGAARSTGIGTHAWAGSYSYRDDMDADAATTVNLDTVTVSATASAFGDYSDADAYGIWATVEAQSGKYAGIHDNSHADASADLNVTLSSSAISVAAYTNGTHAPEPYDYYDAYSVGIKADSTADAISDNQSAYATANSNITLSNGSTLSATATAAGDYYTVSGAFGIKSSAESTTYAGFDAGYSDSDAYSTVTLTNTELTVTSTADSTGQAEAWATGIESDTDAESDSYAPAYAYTSNEVTLDNTTLESTATAYSTGSSPAFKALVPLGGGASADAHGIDASASAYADSYSYNSYAESDLSISLSNNSSINATANATATGSVGGTFDVAARRRADVWATAVGIEGHAHTDAFADDNGYWDGAEGYADVSVSLDNSGVSAVANTTGDYGYAAATAIQVYANTYSQGIYTYALSDSGVNINLLSSAISATATLAGDDGHATAAGVDSVSWAESRSPYDDMDATSYTFIGLDTVTLSAQATATGDHSEADALGITAVDTAEGSEMSVSSGYSDTSSTIELDLYDSSSVTVAAISNGAYANAYANGIAAASNSRSYVSNEYADAHSDVSINLTDSTLTATAGASGAYIAWAGATGINSSAYSDSRGWYGGYADSYSFADSAINLTNSSVNVAATVTGIDQAEAWAQGIETDTYAESDSFDPADASTVNAITLDDSTINSQATASGTDNVTAYAGGIDAWARADADADDYYSDAESDVNISLSNASVITATATASTTGVDADALAEAIGIRADAHADAYADTYWGGEGYANVAINLNNSTITATATATAIAGGEGSATAIEAFSDAYSRTGETFAYSDSGVDLYLTTATLNASASFTGKYGHAQAYGVHTGAWAESQADDYNDQEAWANTTVDLDTVSISAVATASGEDTDAYATGIDTYVGAEGGGWTSQTGDAFADASATVTLLASSVTATATTTGDSSYAEAVGIDAHSSADADGGHYYNNYTYTSHYYDGTAQTSTTINLTDSSVAATASAEGESSDARATGLLATAHSYSYEYYTTSESDVLVTLSSSAVTAIATATGDYSDAEAYGLVADATAYNGGDEKYSSTNAAVTLLDSMVMATATADGYSGDASATGMVVESESSYYYAPGASGIAVNLTNSSVSAIASATGEYGNANAYGVLARDNKYSSTMPDITINLDNAAISAQASGGSAFGSSYALGLGIDNGETVTITLTDASISATATGYDSQANGIAIYNVDTATINIDAASSVSGDDFAIRVMDAYAATVNNAGLIAGRVNVTDLNNSATGILQATLTGGDSEWIDPASVTPLTGDYYFSASESASLADDGTFRIAVAENDNLGFTAIGQVRQYRLLGTGTDGGDWDPAMVNIVKYGYQSPLLEYSYDETLSDADHFIISAKVMNPLEAGLTDNAEAAALAALRDGMLDFTTDPELWSPEVMSKVFGTMQFIHGNLYNIENRLHGKKGASSGDAAAENHAWLDANYTDATQDMRDNIEGFDTETMAFNLGYDRNFSANTVLGLSFGYGNTEAETELSRRSLDMDEYMLSLYGQFKGSSWFGEGQLSAGWGSIDSKRIVGANTYTASYDSNSYYAKIAGGMNIESGSWSVMPKASIDYTSISFDDYQEVGGPLALAVSSDSFSSSNLGAGLMAMNKGKVVTPEFGAMLYYDLIGDTIQTSSRFNGGTTYFQTEGADPARLSWELNAGLTFEAPGTPITFKVGYDLLGREDFISHNFNGKLTFDF